MLLKGAALAVADEISRWPPPVRRTRRYPMAMRAALDAAMLVRS